MEPNSTTGRIAHAMCSSSLMLISWFTVLVLCYTLFIFRIRSVVGAEENILCIFLLLDINAVFTIKFRTNIIGATVILNLSNAHNKRDFISFHCEYLFNL